MTSKGLLRLLLGGAITAFFIYLIARQVRVDDIVAAAHSARPLGVLLALLAFLLGFACRIARWQAMLRIDNPTLGWSQCCGPFVASFAANNVLPLRAGDLLRIMGFNQRLGVGAANVTATMFVERLLDLMMLLCLLGLALLAFDLRLQQVARVGSGTLLALAALILLFLSAPKIPLALAEALLRRLAKIAPALHQKLRPPVEQGLNTLLHLSHGATMGRLIAWSAAAWLCEGLMFWLAAEALPSISKAQAAWLAFPIATLSTLVPSTPGYVGTFDYFAALAMQLLGNDAASATVYAILTHLLLWLPPTLVGAVYLMIAPPDRFALKERLT